MNFEPNRWERFLDSLDTSGGHIVMLLLLMVSGIAMIRLQLPKGDDILVGTFSALLVILKEVHSNRTRLRDAAKDETTNREVVERTETVSPPKDTTKEKTDETV